MRVTLDRSFETAFADSGTLPEAPAFHHAFAGVLMLADWLGSDEGYFPFINGEGDDRMAYARPKAKQALREIGLDPAASRTALLARPPSFTTAFAVERARPIQEAITSPEANLLVLEAETGSGKTEAALWRFATLFRDGLVDGLYFALPTRVAATQIFERVKRFRDHVFPGEDRPAVVLAVPGQMRLDDAEGRPLPGFKVQWNDDPRDAGTRRMEGFLGAGNYGISRMNGGFANRAALGIVPGGGPGAHVRRDIRRLIELRSRLAQGGAYVVEGGLALVWLKGWDGTASLKASELDPYYVEICRRVRLVPQDGGLRAHTGGSKVPRIVPTPGGETGDPWTPVVKENDARKAFTVDAGGFGYRRMVRLMFDREAIDASPLQTVSETDDPEGLALVARALTRGQGKTEGYHERIVPLSKTVRVGFRKGATDLIAQAAQDRVALAGSVQSVLKMALYSLFQNGPDEIDYRDKGAERRAGRFLARFDDRVDGDFFPRLWQEFEEGADGHAVRAVWIGDLTGRAFALLDAADEGASKAVQRRYRARSRAEAAFHGTLRHNKHLKEFFPEKPHDDEAA